MKRNLIGGIIAATLSILSVSAFAWTEDDCKKVNYNHPDCDKYPRPTPQPTPSPQPVTVTANPSATADADAAAKAAADAIAKAIATGGNAAGGDAKAISDNWNKLSADQQQKLMATLTNEQRQALTATLNNTTTANGGAGGAGGNAAGGNAAGGNAAGGNAAGGNAAGGMANGQGSGNSTVTNTTTTTNYRQVSVQPLFMPTPASVIASGQIVTERTNCGPVMGISRKGVLGTHIGFFTNTKVDLGEDMEAVPVFDPKTGEQVMYVEREFMEAGQRVIRRFGSQLFFVYALPTVSAASSFSIGGAGANGGGNAGGGSSSAMSRIVTKAQIVSCEIQGGYRLVEVPPPAPAVSKDEMKDALALAQALSVKIEYESDRVVPKPKTCVRKHFKDEAGNDHYMCPGSKSGTYNGYEVVPEKRTAIGRLESAAGAKSATEKK